MQQLLEQAQLMQRQMAKAQADLAEARVVGTSGGGLVTVTLTGTGEVVGVTIDPRAVDPEDVETLEDLVLAALRNAADNTHALAEQTMGPLTAGLATGPAGGLGLPGM